MFTVDVYRITHDSVTFLVMAKGRFMVIVMVMVMVMVMVS